MASLLERIGKANPKSKANDAFVNAVFQQQFGRPATAAELQRFKNTSVADVANVVLRDKSPFKGKAGGGVGGYDLTKDIANSNPGAKANKEFINAVYRQTFGRDATKAELRRFGDTSVADVANIVMRDASPFKGKSFGGENGLKGKSGGAPTAPQTTDKTPAGPGMYKGKEDKFGQLPQYDGKGGYRVILEDGTVYTTPGFSLDKGKTGWEYLGDQFTPDQWGAAEALFRTSGPPPVPLDIMNKEDQQRFLNQAYQEISSTFVNDIQEGKNDLIGELGAALQNYSDLMQQENLAEDQDIKNTIDAMELAGLSFTGKSREQLGDFFAASGNISDADRQTIAQNFVNLREQREAQVVEGQAAQDINMPKPPGWGTPQWESKPEAEKEKAWQDFFQTDTWKQYKANTDTMAGLGGTPQEGIAGTGTYGIGDQLNRFAGTRALEGNILKQHRGLQESSRRTFNDRIKTLGTTAERLLGSANLQGLNYPTLGGQSIFSSAQNVLGSLQSGFQTNTYSRANELTGNYASQYANIFPRTLTF